MGAVPDDRRQLLGRDRVVRNRLPSWIGDAALQVFGAKLAVNPFADGNQSNASDEIEDDQRKHDVCS